MLSLRNACLLYPKAKFKNVRDLIFFFLKMQQLARHILNYKLTNAERKAMNCRFYCEND